MTAIPDTIRDLLLKVGIPEGNIEEAFADIQKLIDVRAVEASAQQGDPESLAHLKTLSIEEAKAYLAQHPDTLPQLNAETYQQIAVDVIKEYVQAVKE